MKPNTISLKGICQCSLLLRVFLWLQDSLSTHLNPQCTQISCKMASFVSVIVGLIIMACAFAGLIVAADECTRHPRALWCKFIFRSVVPRVQHLTKKTDEPKLIYTLLERGHQTNCPGLSPNHLHHKPDCGYDSFNSFLQRRLDLLYLPRPLLIAGWNPFTQLYQLELTLLNLMTGF